MRRVLLGLFLLALLLDAFALAVLGHAVASDPRFPFDARKALLGRFGSDGDLRHATPAALAASPRFATDPPELVAEWSRSLPEEVEYLRGVSHSSLPREPTARAKALVRLFSRNGGAGCGAYRDLLHNIRRLPRDGGRGCCSDHAQVFIALASAYGLHAREVHQHRPSGRGHTYNEFWHPKLEKWVYIDPQLAVMARSPEGIYLSQLEMRARALRGRPIDFEFFGSASHRLHGRDPGDYHFYDEASDFSDVTLTLGSNVFEQDRFEQRLRFLPRPVAQLLGYVAGPTPGYQMVLDEHSRKAPELRSLRRVLLGGGAFLGGATLACALLLLATDGAPALRRRAARRQGEASAAGDPGRGR